MPSSQRFFDLPVSWRVIPAAGLVLAVVMAFAVTFCAHEARRVALHDLAMRLTAEAGQRATALNRQIDQLRQDAFFLANVPPVEGIARASANGGVDPQTQTPETLWVQQLQAIFTVYAKGDPALTQLRLIGVAHNGRELVRVNHDRRGVAVVPSNELQEKGNRDFYRATLLVPAGRIYISALDLNQEHGKVEQPHIPTLRAATPVFGPDGKIFGMIVVNLDATNLLETIGATLPAGFQAYLTNADGDYLLHPDPAKAFGFDIGQRHRWSDDFTPVPTNGAATPARYRSGAGIVYATTRQISLNAADPRSFVTLAVNAPDSIVAAAVARAVKLLVAGLSVGALGIGVMLYFYWLSVRSRQQATVGHARLAAIVESSNDAVIGKTPAGIVTDWNRAAEQMFGYPATEAVGRRVLDLIVPPEYTAEEADILARITRGEVVPHFRTRRRRKDGSFLDVSVTVSPIRSPTGRIVGAAKTVRDISAQRRAETAREDLNAVLEQQVAARTVQLHNLATLHSAILEHTAYPIIATNADGIITLFNPAAERMLGYKAAEVVGKATPYLVHDADEIAARAAALSVELGRPIEPGLDSFVAKTREGRADACEWTYVRKDGSRLPVLITASALRDGEGQIFGYLGMALDLSEQRRYQQQLIESERRYRILVEDQSEMVSLSNRSGALFFVNHAYARHFGCEPDEMVGKSLFDYIPEAEQAKVREHLHAIYDTGGAGEGENHMLSANGAPRWVAWINRALTDEQGRVTAIHSVGRDVTDRKQAQEDLEKLNAALELRTREAEAANIAKSQFLANMSHEIRSPMNAILGMLLLLQRTDLSPGQRGYAANAYSATRSLLGLLNDILDFSKVEAGKIALETSPFGIDELMRDLSGIISASVGSKDIELLFSIDNTLPYRLQGDAFRLRQVLLNLAGNAVKFTEQGEIVIATQVLHQDEREIEIEFSVRDTGIGIAPDMLSEIFEGFRQGESSTTRRYGGTGLGLAISQRLVSLMGGSLDVESELGRGSRFHFRLTLDKIVDAEDGAAAIAQRGLPQDRPLRVLIIDDHRIARDVLLALVESLGWEGECADSARDALERLRRRSVEAPYDVILLDWKMPDLDGFGFIREMRRVPLGAALPLVIMVTAHSREAVAARMKAEGGLLSSFLIKPVTASMLLDAILDVTGARAVPGMLGPTQTLPARLAGLRLLVAEDNSMNQQIARELLSGEGATVEIAADGLVAVQMALAADPPFDAVLMDIQMPTMDGYDATRALRRDPGLRAMPIIAMTANAMAAEKAACLEAGMNDHIAKPIDLNLVVATIQLHCRPAIHPQPAVPSPSAAPEKPAGIDLDLALQRLGGNRTLFANVAARFLIDSAKLAADLPQQTGEERRTGLLVLLHTLKGIAGAVGAQSLENCAAAAELRLKEAGYPADIDAMVAELSASIAETNILLTAIIERFRAAGE